MVVPSQQHHNNTNNSNRRNTKPLLSDTFRMKFVAIACVYVLAFMAQSVCTRKIQVNMVKYSESIIIMIRMDHINV